MPDNREPRRWTQVEHVIRLPGSLVCIETKSQEGLIFGGARQSRWTQVLGRNKYSFQNFLRQNFKHLKALTAAACGVPTQSLVVFVGRARFTKGVPEGVCTLDKLVEHLQAMARNGPAETTAAAWRQLLDARSTGSGDCADHLSDLKARHGSDLCRASTSMSAGVSQVGRC